MGDVNLTKRRLTLVGGLPTEASLLLAHMLRGEGSTKEASAGMMLGGILNMILDPVFIFGFHMGVGGAGFATMLSNLVCLCFYGIVLYRNRANTVVSLHPDSVFREAERCFWWVCPPPWSSHWAPLPISF